MIMLISCKEEINNEFPSEKINIKKSEMHSEIIEGMNEFKKIRATKESTNFLDIYLIKFYSQNSDLLIFSYYMIPNENVDDKDFIKFNKNLESLSCLVCPDAKRRFKVSNHLFIPSCGQQFLDKKTKLIITDFFEFMQNNGLQWD